MSYVDSLRPPDIIPLYVCVFSYVKYVMENCLQTFLCYPGRVRGGGGGGLFSLKGYPICLEPPEQVPTKYQNTYHELFNIMLDNRYNDLLKQTGTVNVHS